MQINLKSVNANQLINMKLNKNLQINLNGSDLFPSWEAWYSTMWADYVNLSLLGQNPIQWNLITLRSSKFHRFHVSIPGTVCWPNTRTGCKRWGFAWLTVHIPLVCVSGECCVTASHLTQKPKPLTLSWWFTINLQPCPSLPGSCNTCVLFLTHMGTFDLLKSVSLDIKGHKTNKSENSLAVTHKSSTGEFM